LKGSCWLTERCTCDTLISYHQIDMPCFKWSHVAGMPYLYSTYISAYIETIKESISLSSWHKTLRLFKRFLVRSSIRIFFFCHKFVFFF
jgi:hypothetical protein